MNKGMIISYFDKVTKDRYISTSVTQLASKLNFHRNTIMNWIGANGWYEDATCLVFYVDNKDVMIRNRAKKEPKTSISLQNTKPKDIPKTVQSVQLIAQPSAMKTNPKVQTMTQAWKELRESEQK